MPHCILEYTANLREHTDIAALLHKINGVLIAQETPEGKVFPIGGVRSRAIALTDYCVADGAADVVADAAFVHVTLKIGAGRSAAVKQRAGDALFAVVKAHFAELYAHRALALSMEICEFSESGSWKHNNIHARYKALKT